MRDPRTGAVYHLQYDPPNAADAPLVNGRLERVTDPTHEEAQMVRLAAAAVQRALCVNLWAYRMRLRCRLTRVRVGVYCCCCYY